MSIKNLKRNSAKLSFTSQKLKKATSSDLESALKLNVQLEKENLSLRAQVYDLTLKNSNLSQTLNRNKERLQVDFIKLQEDIRMNEKQLVENTKKCLEQQNKFADEIKKLKSKNEDLKNEKQEIENLLTEKLKSLESEMKLIKLDNQNLRYRNKDNEDKIGKYKTKLKHAVEIVGELNQIVAENKRKPENVCEMTQINLNGIKASPIDQIDCALGGDPRFQRDLNSENLLLSDIFFKPKTFMENEIDLFTVK